MMKRITSEVENLKQKILKKHLKKLNGVENEQDLSDGNYICINICIFIF